MLACKNGNEIPSGAGTTPVLLSSTDVLVTYHCPVGTHIGHEKYVYTKLWNSAEESKTKDFNSPRNEPVLVIYYWSNKIEEYFHLHKSDNINLFE